MKITNGPKITPQVSQPQLPGEKAKVTEETTKDVSFDYTGPGSHISWFTAILLIPLALAPALVIMGMRQIGNEKRDLEKARIQEVKTEQVDKK